MKKKPRDFQKVKLKVGKHLPKGRNETKTSFQTKKINLHEQLKETVEEPTLKELLSFLKSNDVKIKCTNLGRLSKYVSNHKETLPMFFPDILKELGRILQESEAKIRSEAISILGQCAEILTDIQLKSFIVPLTSYLNCMMTHLALQVRQDSLKFLDILLNSHCTVICQSYEILFYLLDMISYKNIFGKNENKIKDGRRLCDVITNKISADEWREDVLERMLAFFKGLLLKKDSMPMDTVEKKEVYWDAKEALYLPLYLNSGVKPAKFDFSLFCPVNSECCNSRSFKTFISELISILSAILKSMNIRRCNSESVTKYLSTIIQILCCIGEWIIENLDLHDALNIVEELVDISHQLVKKFPFDNPLGQVVQAGQVQREHLILGICYFYSICSFLNEKYVRKSYIDEWKDVQSFILRIFEDSSSGIKLNEKSISLLLKICKILIQCKNAPERIKHGMIASMLGLLEVKKFHPIANDLYSFFMDVSFNYDYKDLQCSVLKEWFCKLLEHLIFMMEYNRIVPNFLHYIRQVCARRNTEFMQSVNYISSETFIKALKYDDEDFQLTIIHLIVSLSNIPNVFLEDLARTIREASFPLKTACRLIRCLHSRYSKPDVPDFTQRRFLKFLLNLGCDTFLIAEPSINKNPLPLTDMLINFQQSCACHCEIYPTSDFVRHHEIFKVCADCLPPYLEDDEHSKSAVLFIRTIFSDHARYPLHSVVAFIELFTRFSVLVNDKDSVDFLQNFLYSCLLYNSLVTKDLPIQHWNYYCVPAVQDCLDYANALDIVDFMNRIHNIKIDQLYHILRILVFLMHRGLLDVRDKKPLYEFLNKLNKLDAVHKQAEFEMMLHDIYDYLASI